MKHALAILLLLLLTACTGGKDGATPTATVQPIPNPTTDDRAPAPARTKGPFGDAEIEAAVDSYLRTGVDTTSSGLPMLCAETRKSTSERWDAACARYRAGQER